MSQSDSPHEAWKRFGSDTFLVVGFTERTGLSVARAFERHAIPYKISDLRPIQELHPLLADLSVPLDHVFCGPQTTDQLTGITRVILSPGVPRSIPLVVEADRRGIPVLGDVDFVQPFLGKTRIVAVTGTDGKTSTTTLVAQILQTRYRVVVAGNIGIPVFSKLEEIGQADVLVLEMSSFMLERLTSFRPHVAGILNIAEDHVDRYPSPQDYANAKLNLLRHCTSEDLFIQNLDDPVLAGCDEGTMRRRTTSKTRKDADYVLHDGVFHIAGHTLARASCAWPGIQNADNILMAAAIGCELGVDPSDVLDVIYQFRGLPHRYELVEIVGGVRVINDSKATTVHAVGAALGNHQSNVVLILGGRDKGLDFGPLRQHVRSVKHLVCYGEAGPRIFSALGWTRAERVESFEDAVLRAVGHCSPGDVLLLSPGCVSWDQFADYQERGEVFRDLAVSRLKSRFPEPGEL